MKVSVLIPCHNEEKSIYKCVRSCLNQTRPADEIIVVNDGSTDKSSQILKRFGRKIIVIDIFPATGNKSYAQEKGLSYITGDVFVAIDGDSIMEKNLIKRIEEDFQDEKIAAVGGYVRSLKYNWLTACRAYEYAIGQNIHKQAQSSLGYIFVIPGAAGAFRTEIFKKFVRFDHDTITEDLDFTYKLHQNNLKIKYDRKAIVFTQDPNNLSSYINQVRRWYGGGWQNLLKHLSANLLSHPGRSLELALIYSEGLIYSSLFFIIPIINFFWALKMYLLLLTIVLLETIYAAFKEKRADLLIVPFVYPLILYINGYVFLEQFAREVIFKKKNLVWFQPERVKI